MHCKRVVIPPTTHKANSNKYLLVLHPLHTMCLPHVQADHLVPEHSADVQALIKGGLLEDGDILQYRARVKRGTDDGAAAPDGAGSGSSNSLDGSHGSGTGSGIIKEVTLASVKVSSPAAVPTLLYKNH